MLRYHVIRPGRNRRGAAAGQFHLVEPEALAHLLRDDLAEDRNAEQALELGRRHLGEHALLELEPQPRHREKQRRLRALQVREEGIERLGEEEVNAAVDQRRALRPRPFETVRQRQVGQHAVIGSAHSAQHLGRDAFAGARECLEGDHHALRRAGRSGGIDQHRQFVGVARRSPLQRLRSADDRIPGVELGLRCERERDTGHALGHAGLLVRPRVELADEEQARLAVRQHVIDRLGGLGREDGHGRVPGHPDRQLRHDEVRAVLRQNRDARTPRETLALQVRGHAPRLVNRLAPGGVHDLVVADRLRHVDVIAKLLLVVEDVIQHEPVLCHVSSVVCLARWRSLLQRRRSGHRTAADSNRATIAAPRRPGPIEWRDASI